MTAQTSRVAIQPLVGWPREAEQGQTYLMTVDLRLAAGATWPYEKEEYSVYCIITAGPTYSLRPIGTPAVMLHRYGGSYGPARFLLTALEATDDSGLRLSLLNRWGLPILGVPLPMRIFSNHRDRQETAAQIGWSPQVPFKGTDHPEIAQPLPHMNETKGSVEPRSSPYFGLDYYQEKFGEWFFGREVDSDTIITNLRTARLTLLEAESGVGTSSLLRAGVAWRIRKLADDSFARREAIGSVPIVFSSWKDDPVLELMGAIREAIRPYLAGRPEPELPTDRLDAAIETASGALNASLLIMLDQFEEYFLYRSREPIPERFADELARCINRADLRANFLIAIHSEAYAGLGRLFKGRVANVYGNYLHVEYLDRASAEEAITKPLDVYNHQPGVSEYVQIQDALVEAVLGEVRSFDGDGDDGGRFVTPLLQLVMETLWERERAEGSRVLRISTLQRLQGVRMIVDTHLGKALSALGSGERQIAIDMFDHLVTPSGGIIAESVPDLANRTGHSEEQIGRVLDKLDQARIVRPLPAPPGQDPIRFRRYEIFHSVLAPAINRAIVAREERRPLARRLRRLWQR